LLFADDVANCAETVSKLQHQLNVINQFCLQTGMEVNLSKTELLFFLEIGVHCRYMNVRGNRVQTTIKSLNLND